MTEDRSNVENDIMTLKKRFTPNATQPCKCIVLPNTNTTHFELKPAILQLLPTFYGKKMENPYTNVDEFLDIYSTSNFKTFLRVSQVKALSIFIERPNESLVESFRAQLSSRLGEI